MIACNKILLHLSLIKGIGPITVQQLLVVPHIDITSLYDWCIADFVSVGISIKNAQQLVNGLSDHSCITREQELLEKYNIRWVSFLDDNYPELLKNIYMPPIGFYMQGNLLNNQHLAIVGSRKAYHYAQKVIDDIVPSLVQANYVIVSGGAVGIDAMAHKAALKYYGKTIVVCGSGLLRPYPAHHVSLFQEIVEKGGAVISPFMLEQVPKPGNFPARNRIISGISRGCLVVQAAQKSGASITAQFALEQGRDVFAIPGSVIDPLSKGCHNLIRQGATLISCAQDLLQDLGVTQDRVIQREVDSNPELLTKETDAQKIIRLCKQKSSLDDIVAQLNLPVDQVQQILFDLRLDQKVEQDFTGLWISH